MSEFSPSRLLEILEGLPGDIRSRQLCVALSGGLDSMVLLHALAQLREQRREWQLRAVHINHQLQKDAMTWGQQCLEQCARLEVPCTVLAVAVADIKDQGMEAAARQARYAALQIELKPDELLLTAHHANDQLETVLIALMRGAGLDGMAAMPEKARFGHAWHVRPLLGFTRDELQAWAERQTLSYISDPSNIQTHFDRNYLRHEMIQRLQQRWPAAAITAVRTASHLGDARALLHDYVNQDFSHAVTANTLNIEVLRRWSSVRRRAVIRYWLQFNDVLMPSTRVLQALEHDMFNSDEDRVPCTRWSTYAVHRYRDHLHLEKHYRAEHVAECLQWTWREPLQLPHDLGSLMLNAGREITSTTALSLNSSTLPSQLRVQFRQGGERLQLPNEPFHRELKQLFNDAGVLPWWRGRVPLVYAGDHLVAVADLWVSAQFVAVDTQPMLQLQWLHAEKALFAAI